MPRHAEICTIPTHVAGDVHSTQLTRKNEEIARLQAEVDALRADLAMIPHLDPQLADLLVYAAGSLRIGQEAAHPHPPSVSYDKESRKGKPESRPPRGGDPRARRALSWLVTSMTRTLDAFNTQKDNDWNRVTVGESAVDVEA